MEKNEIEAKMLPLCHHVNQLRHSVIAPLNSLAQPLFMCRNSPKTNFQLHHHLHIMCDLSVSENLVLREKIHRNPMVQIGSSSFSHKKMTFLGRLSAERNQHQGIGHGRNQGSLRRRCRGSRCLPKITGKNP